MQEQEQVYGQSTLPITTLKPQYDIRIMSEMTETNISGSWDRSQPNPAKLVRLTHPLSHPTHLTDSLACQQTSNFKSMTSKTNGPILTNSTLYLAACLQGPSATGPSTSSKHMTPSTQAVGSNVKTSLSLPAATTARSPRTHTSTSGLIL